mgnify:CR=1 FL=1
MVISVKPKDKSIEIGRIEGWVEIIVRDKDGRLKYYRGYAHRKPSVDVGELKTLQDRIDEELERVNRKVKTDGGGLGSIINVLSPALPAKFLDFYWRKNVITNVGLAEIIKLVFNLGGTPFTYLAIGTGTTAEAVTDTALENEIARKSATVTQETTDVDGDTAKLEATFSSDDGLTGTSDVSECGVFNASSGGVLLARKTFSPVPLNWDAGDSLTIRYYIQMAR